MSFNEKDLINYNWQAFLKGNEEAFTYIYKQVAANLFSYGKKFNIDEENVNDAIQEVFVDLFLKRQKINIEIQNLKAYLFVALKNNLLKKLNHRKRIPTLTLDTYNDLDFNIVYDQQEQLIFKENTTSTNDKLNQAIETLSKKQKEIIYLKFEEELDYPEIAKIMQISIESARKQIYRALKTLRKSLDYKELETFFKLFIKKH